MDKVQKKNERTLVMLCSLFYRHLAIQALVLLHMFGFRAIWFGASYANSRQPHTFKHQM